MARNSAASLVTEGSSPAISVQVVVDDPAIDGPRKHSDGVFFHQQLDLGTFARCESDADFIGPCRLCGLGIFDAHQKAEDVLDKLPPPVVQRWVSQQFLPATERKAAHGNEVAFGRSLAKDADTID